MPEPLSVICKSFNPPSCTKISIAVAFASIEFSKSSYILQQEDGHSQVRLLWVHLLVFVWSHRLRFYWRQTPPISQYALQSRQAPWDQFSWNICPRAIVYWGYEQSSQSQSNRATFSKCAGQRIDRNLLNWALSWSMITDGLISIPASSLCLFIASLRLQGWCRSDKLELSLVDFPDIAQNTLTPTRSVGQLQSMWGRLISNLLSTKNFWSDKICYDTVSTNYLYYIHLTLLS